MRLIDATLFEHAVLEADEEEICDECASSIVDMLSRFPTVDAVEVVRCKDCKYFQQLGRCSVKSESYTVPEGFCHFGVRMTEDKQNEVD